MYIHGCEAIANVNMPKADLPQFNIQYFQNKCCKVYHLIKVCMRVLLRSRDVD